MTMRSQIGWRPSTRRMDDFAEKATHESGSFAGVAPPPREAWANKGEAERCWICDGHTIEVHFKIVCVNCGFRRDCSDP